MPNIAESRNIMYYTRRLFTILTNHALNLDSVFSNPSDFLVHIFSSFCCREFCGNFLSPPTIPGASTFAATVTGDVKIMFSSDANVNYPGFSANVFSGILV